MFQEFFKQIPKNVKNIAFYGAGTVAYKLKEELEKYNKDIKILYYIDREKIKDEKGLLFPIIKPFEIENIKDKIDLVIVTIVKASELVDILELYNIPYICISTVMDNKIRLAKYEKDFKKACEVFKKEEDRKLYENIWNLRINLDYAPIEKYAKEKYNISKFDFPRNHQFHYLEYINLNAIKTVIDCGFFNGINTLSFKKHFPNLQKIWAFEPLYDLFKDDNYDAIYKKLDCVNVVPYATWDKKEDLEIIINGSSSNIAKNKLVNRYGTRKIPASTIDNLCQEYDIKKVDFIKMDIEGSEMKALRGGGSVIRKDRCQLAISIYHSIDDFVYIPLYLAETLENYVFRFAHYSANTTESVIYAIPQELA